MKHTGWRYTAGTRRLRAGLTLCGVVAMLGGCRKEHVRAAGPPPATKISIPDSLRARILAAAAGTYFDTTPGRASAITLPGDSSSTVIAPDTGARDRSRASLASGAVIARITGRRGFARLGISPGSTYVWVDSLSGGRRTLMVPGKPRGDVYEMATSLGSHIIADSVPSSAHWYADTTLRSPGDAAIAYYFNSRCNNTCCISPSPSSADFARVDAAFQSMLSP